MFNRSVLPPQYMEIAVVFVNTAGVVLWLIVFDYAVTFWLLVLFLIFCILLPLL